MGEGELHCSDCQDFDETTGPNKQAPKSGDMTAEDRRRVVLATLEETGAAMRSVDVFRNCKLRGATFERRSTNTYLRELVDRGDVLKIDSVALEHGDIKEIDPGETGHYIAATAAERYR